LQVVRGSQSIPWEPRLSHVNDWAEQQLAVLRPKYPDWDLWTVRILVPKRTVWCARPKGSPVATINADSPEALIAEIREQENAL
jgi:hypothetical protein